MTDNIKTQTEALTTQINKLENIPEDDDEQYIKQLEIYNEMLKKADFSIESHASSKKRELTIADKVLVPPVKWITNHVNNLKNELIEYNRRGKK
jgi:hypothetical protein